MNHLFLLAAETGEAVYWSEWKDGAELDSGTQSESEKDFSWLAKKSRDCYTTCLVPSHWLQSRSIDLPSLNKKARAAAVYALEDELVQTVESSWVDISGGTKSQTPIAHVTDVQKRQQLLDWISDKGIDVNQYIPEHMALPENDSGCCLFSQPQRSVVRYQGANGGALHPEQFSSWWQLFGDQHSLSVFAAPAVKVKIPAGIEVNGKRRINSLLDLAGESIEPKSVWALPWHTASSVKASARELPIKTLLVITLLGLVTFFGYQYVSLWQLREYQTQVQQQALEAARPWQIFESTDLDAIEDSLYRRLQTAQAGAPSSELAKVLNMSFSSLPRDMDFQMTRIRFDQNKKRLVLDIRGDKTQIDSYLKKLSKKRMFKWRTNRWDESSETMTAETNYDLSR